MHNCIFMMYEYIYKNIHSLHELLELILIVLNLGTDIMKLQRVIVPFLQKDLKHN